MTDKPTHGAQCSLEPYLFVDLNGLGVLLQLGTVGSHLQQTLIGRALGAERESGVSAYIMSPLWLEAERESGVSTYIMSPLWTVGQ